jgi:hypothetical protein
MESGGAIKAAEPNAELQTLVATLTASIVGPGDGLHDLNMTRLMRSCRADGTVLKADRPAIAIDQVWAKADTRSEISFTFSKLPNPPSVGGTFSVHYLLAADVTTSYNITPADLGVSPSATTASFIAYNYYSGTVVPFGTDMPLQLLSAQTGQTAAAVKFDYYTISPVGPDGVAFIGEPNKYITASSKRFVGFEVGASGVGVGSATTACVPDEKLRACIWKNTSGLECREATCGADSSAVITF